MVILHKKMSGSLPFCILLLIINVTKKQEDEYMCRLVDVTTNTGDIVRVSEYKKQQIEEIINKASDCTMIDQIILFGSSLNSDCKKNSDIDVVIISKASVSKLSQNKRYRAYWERIYKLDSFQTDYDVLYFTSYEDIERKKEQVPVCKEIIEKGKIIYHKKGEECA